MTDRASLENRKKPASPTFPTEIGQKKFSYMKADIWSHNILTPTKGEQYKHMYLPKLIVTLR